MAEVVRVDYKAMFAEMDRLPMPEFVEVVVKFRGEDKPERFIMNFGHGFDLAAARTGLPTQTKNEVPYAASKAAMNILKSVAYKRAKEAHGV